MADPETCPRCGEPAHDPALPKTLATCVKAMRLALAEYRGTGPYPEPPPAPPPPPAPRIRRGEPIEMADGHTWIVPYLSIDEIDQAAEFYGVFADPKKWLSADGKVAAVSLIHLAMVKNYPFLTPAQTARLIDFGNLPDMLEKIWNMSGLRERVLALVTGSHQSAA